MKKIYLLTDYRDTFYSNVTKARKVYSSLDINVLKQLFANEGWTLEVMRFADINFSSHQMSGKYVLYQSSEDNGGLYKSYIDDVVYALHMQGVKLIPHYPLFKAHHNKVFMELLRSVIGETNLQSLDSRSLGALDELYLHKDMGYPIVIKSSAGAGSSGVKLVNNYAELLSAAKKISSSFSIKEWINSARLRLKGIHKRIVPHSLYRNKFILQQFIPGLKGDSKILVFNNKYYVLNRRNRKDDFRASGSGLFQWPETVSDEMLNFAKSCFEAFDAPCASFDIGYDGEKYYLIEFQFLSFGPLTLVGSTQFFTLQNKSWVIERRESDYPTELVKSIVAYINKKDNL